MVLYSEETELEATSDEDSIADEDATGAGISEEAFGNGVEVAIVDEDGTEDDSLAEDEAGAGT